MVFVACCGPAGALIPRLVVGHAVVRGFAVLTAEVMSLAQQIAKAADQIGAQVFSENDLRPGKPR